jgi:hypothetical protein
VPQCLDNPLAHLACGLLGERERNDALGLIHQGEKSQVPLNQQLRFA